MTDPVVDYYSGITDSYDRRFRHPFARRIHNIETAFVRTHVSDTTSVLEFGAGTGRMTAELLRIAGSVTVAEPAEMMLTALQRRFAGTKLLLERAGIDELSRVPSYGSFDVVAGFHVLPHIADLSHAFRILGAAVRPGGKVMFDLWNSATPYVVMRRLFRRPNPVLTIYRRESEMIELISSAGLDITSHIAWGFPLGQQLGLSLDMLGDVGTRAVTKMFSRYAYGHLFAATVRHEEGRDGVP